jgi:hypothetical protein
LVFCSFNTGAATGRGDQNIVSVARNGARSSTGCSVSVTVGLLPEEYDVIGKRQLGNFTQAFTHVMFVNSARNLSHDDGPSEHRTTRSEQPMKPSANGSAVRAEPKRRP